MTSTVTAGLKAWPALAPVFIPPPPTGWQDWPDDEDEDTPPPVAVTVSGPHPTAVHPAYPAARRT